MIKRILPYLLVLSTLDCFSQLPPGYTEVKLMSWNVLNWPSNSNLVNDTTERCPAYRDVIGYTNPDILITCEITSADGVMYFRDQVLNSGPYHYLSGTFINGYDTDNAIFYRDSLFEFVSNQPITTSLRDISHFTLVFKATSDTLHIFSCHLKASQGYETQRAAEVAELRTVTNAFPAGTNFFIGGDFNIYYASEPAYLGLLRNNATDDGNFLDPLHMTGTWNNPSYAQYHTQSTRINGSGGSGGGLNDRFDMLLYSNGVASPTGVYYVPGSLMNIGNDGHHYDKDINYGTNTMYPDSIADALYIASDHLPVMVTLQIGPTSGIDEANANVGKVEVYPQPVTGNSIIRLTLKKSSKVNYVISDLVGRQIESSGVETYGQGEHFLPVDWQKFTSNGLYFLSVNINNTLINRKILFIK